MEIIPRVRTDCLFAVGAGGPLSFPGGAILGVFIYDITFANDAAPSIDVYNPTQTLTPPASSVGWGSKVQLAPNGLVLLVSDPYFDDTFVGEGRIYMYTRSSITGTFSSITYSYPSYSFSGFAIWLYIKNFKRC